MDARWLARHGQRAADGEGAAGGLAAAAAAALAGGAARQRLGDRAPATGSSSSTPGWAARGGCASSTWPWPRPASGSRTSACSSAPTPTPTTTGSPRRSSRRPAASSGCTRAWEHVRLLADDPAAALEHRLEVARQSGVPVAGAGALPRVARERRRDRDRRDPGARPRARPRGRGRDRPRRLAGLRDPRPRSLARRPAPARAQADDLRRPPARPHRPLLRLRPHAPTRSANSSPA